MRSIFDQNHDTFTKDKNRMINRCFSKFLARYSCKFDGVDGRSIFAVRIFLSPACAPNAVMSLSARLDMA